MSFLFLLFLFVSLPFSASTPLFGYFCFLLSAASLPLLPPCLSQSPTSTPASTSPLSLPSPPLPDLPPLALPHLLPPTHATPPTPRLLPPLSRLTASFLVCGTSSLPHHCGHFVWVIASYGYVSSCTSSIFASSSSCSTPFLLSFSICASSSI